MTVHVLIPVHNRVNTTLECLDCLYAQDYGEFRVVVVDDGSTDGTSERIKERYPQTELVRGDGNLWWTGAMRVGVEHILKTVGTEDFILALNDDVTFAKEYISCIVDASIRNGRAITGSVYQAEESGEYSVDGASVRWGFLDTSYTIPSFSTRDEMPEVIDGLDTLYGHGLLIPVEVFRKIGNFNSRDLPHYGGDTEFTYRAGKAGFGLIASARAELLVKLDKAHTGVHHSEKWYMSFSQAWQVLLSVKSACQLKSGFKLLDLYCPWRYRPINKLTVLKICLGQSIGRTLPFMLLRLSARYLLGPFPVPAAELTKLGLDIESLVDRKMLRVRCFRGRHFCIFQKQPDVAGSPEERLLAEVYSSSMRLGSKIKWARSAL